MRTSFNKMVSIRTAAFTACLWGGVGAPVFCQTVDSFNPGAFMPETLAIQADGKVLVGEFVNLRRINSSGTVDTTFNPSPNFEVHCLLIQPDGAIVVGGGFTILAGKVRRYLGRLNADGTLDSSFKPGPNGSVYCLALQPDGKILVGGSFTNIAGEARDNIARLNPDGTLDSSFNASATGLTTRIPFSIPLVFSLAVQTDGGVLVGGLFTNLSGVNIANLGRLNSDGTVDGSFQAGASATVQCLAVQPDGKILAGAQGGFGGGTTNLWRLNNDGTWDPAFKLTANSGISSLALQADGKILIASGSALRRLNSDGSRDTNFSVQITYYTTPSVNSLAIQADGKIILAGAFSAINGQYRTNIGRLNNNSSATQDLSFDGSTIVWLRAGSSPEAWRTTFHASTNGTDWFSLGPGTRIAGGWQSGIVSAPTNSTLLARGFITGGLYVGSSWCTETSIGPPAISVQPTSRTNNAGTVSGFSVQSAGTGPLIFQWLKESVALGDSGNISGAHTSTLTLSNVLGADAGAYSVVITNALGSVTSQVATLSVVDPFITKQPGSFATNAGQTATFSVAVTGTLPLSYQWRRNGSNLAGATAAVLVLMNLQRADAANYDVVITNIWGSITSSIAVLTVNLATLDSFGSGADSIYGSAAVYALALQQDNKVSIGGDFTSLGGKPASELGRLNADGTFDGTFNGSAGSPVESLAVQEDGRILAAGWFYTLNGQTLQGLGRLNADGTLDPAFNPSPMGGLGPPVNCLALQADGEILVGGAFTFLGGQQQRYIGRLNPDGTLDTSFNPAPSGFFPIFPAIYSMVLQPDNEIIIGGNFDSLGGWAITNIGRVSPDGTIDGSFNPGASGPIYCLALQPDGRILVGGSFTNLSGQGCTNLGRLQVDGTLDNSFSPSITGGVYTIALQTDGKILLGGSFTNLAGQPRSRIGRLNSDGTLDLTFDPKANSIVNSLLMQADGKILIGGSFTNLAGQTQKAIARLNNTDPAIQSLAFDAHSVTWLRSGASPEVWQVSFDVSTNGADWVRLGVGSRINGGWQLTGLTVPSNAAIRARGLVSGGQYNGSSSLIQAFAGRAVIYSQPMSRTNNAGTPASFSVLAGGTAPLSYQWCKDGANLSDGGNIAGAQAPTLSLSNVFGADAGGYSVLVTNGSGSATSLVANLTVVDPLITVQPSNQWASAGQSVVLSITAVGTSPLSYQWSKDGTNLAGAITATLTLSNVQPPNIGAYDVLVSNRFGSLTSAVATLGVNVATRDSFDPHAEGGVYSILVQPDGKIVLGGYFTSLAGQGQNPIGRLNVDGTLDRTFNVAVTNSTSLLVNALVLQPDGKIVLGGQFSSVNGQARTNLARVNVDGTIDAVFNPGTYFYSYVNCLALHADGKILVGGSFAGLGGTNRSYLGRLNPDGSLDSNFDPGANGVVVSMALRRDGKILVGGSFTLLAGQPRRYIGQLNEDGTLDTAFDPGASNSVVAMALQADGKILVGGSFTNLAGQPRTNIARLNPDGTLDSAFNPGANNIVNAFALQTDGKILVGGRFSILGGQGANSLGVLNADGSRNLTFNPAHNNNVNCLALQPDGKILVGGIVSNVIIRLNNAEAAHQNLAFDRSAIDWLRGGSSPEIWRATFETSTNGTNWISLGAGTRIPGGWQLSGLSLPADSTIRARGFVTGGDFNGSTWFVETTVTPPTILVSDGAFGLRSNQFGFNTRAIPGQAVVIEASTNLMSWIPVQTNLVTYGGLFFFTDPDSAAFPRRFFRARLLTGALPPPSILSSSSGLGFQAGRFGFNLAGVAGQKVVIEASTNLLNWTALTTNTLTSAPLYFSDSGSTNFSWRFYRARLQ